MTTIMVSLAAAEVEKLVAAHQSGIDFGLPSDAVSDEWLVNAENALNRKLPESYKWFLKQYAGGESQQCGYISMITMKE